MNSVAIIGAGQLGSRHLQGIARIEGPIDIYVVDPFEKSLAVSGERFNEISNHTNKTLRLLTNIKELPANLDFVVIATNSKQRLQVMIDLLNQSTVKYMVLEKFLFPYVEEYNTAKELIENNNVRVFVNCARRSWSSYRKLKTLLKHKKVIEMKVSGTNWNLASNSIHFLDLFLYLTEQPTVTADTSQLDSELLENKRKGYIEIAGTIKFNTPIGQHLLLYSSIEESGDPIITINTNEGSVIIDEANKEIRIGESIQNFDTFFQSELTNIIYEQLMDSGDCSLVQFENSINAHLQILNAINLFLGDREGIIT